MDTLSPPNGTRSYHNYRDHVVKKVPENKVIISTAETDRRSPAHSRIWLNSYQTVSNSIFFKSCWSLRTSQEAVMRKTPGLVGRLHLPHFHHYLRAFIRWWRSHPVAKKDTSELTRSSSKQTTAGGIGFDLVASRWLSFWSVSCWNDDII